MAVRCAFTRLARVSELQANPRNPNKHPAPQIELYAKILKHQGIRRPAVVSKESGLIVTGHGLVETLRFLAVRDCPIDEQSFRGSKPGAPGPDELAHLLADNSLPQLADLDANQVAALQSELTLAGLDLHLTGKMLEEINSPNPGKTGKTAGPKLDLKEVFEIVIECGDEAAQQKLFNRFDREGLKCRLLTF